MHDHGRPAQIAGNTDFAFDLLARRRPGNDGSTIPEDATIVRTLVATNVDHGADLRVANALWDATDCAFLPDFEAIMNAHYGGHLVRLDFTLPESARSMINAWVAQATSDRIRELIAPGRLNAETRVVLTNAVHLKAAWLHRSSAGATHPGDFSASPERKLTDVPMMAQVARFSYVDDGTFQMLEPPYEAGLSTLVISRNRWTAWQGWTFSASHLAKWSSAMRQGDVEVYLPRFKITARFELSTRLRAMGMSLSFSEDADFSGITGETALHLERGSRGGGKRRRKRHRGGGNRRRQSATTRAA